MRANSPPEEPLLPPMSVCSLAADAATRVAIWAGAQGLSVASLPGFVARVTDSVLSKWVCFRELAPLRSGRRVLALGVQMSEIALVDVQAQAPSLTISLSRVGVTNVEKVIRIQANGSEQLYSARLDCFVDLGPNQKGAHMSPFQEIVNDALSEVVLGGAALGAPRSTSSPAIRSTSRRRSPGSSPRRSTRCSASPWRARSARAGSSGSAP